MLTGAIVALVLAVTRRLAGWGPPLLALAAPVVLLAAWWVPALVRGAGAALLLESGAQPAPGVGTLDLLAGRLTSLGAPTWAGLLLFALAALALIPRAGRLAVGLCWAVALLAVLVVLGLSAVRLDLPTGPGAAGVGVPLLVLHGALVCAVVLGITGLLRRDAGAGRRLVLTGVTAGLVAGLVVVPLTALVSWFFTTPDLTTDPVDVVPAYMTQNAELAPERGVLIVRGSIEAGLRYEVRRGEGPTVGDDEILALTPPDAATATAVRDLAARPSPAVVDALAGLGVEHVLLPAPVDGAVAAGLDATEGLAQASAEEGARAWLVERPLDPAAVDGPGAAWRIPLLVLQGAGVIVVAVLCAPTLRGRDTATDVPDLPDEARTVSG